MRIVLSHRLRNLVIVGAVALALWAAYEFLWPTYSWENYIDPDEVRIATIRYDRQTYEVHRDRAPRPLSRLVAAINGARRRVPQIKLDVEGWLVVFHRSRGSPVLISGGWERKNGPMLFRYGPSGYYGPTTLYTSRALRRALEAIRASEECRVKRPRIPLKSLSRIVVYRGGSRHALPGSGPHARRVLNAVNGFLGSVDASFYALPDSPTHRSFYQGEVNPQTHLSGTTGALLVLDPPLSMHTNMMFWGRASGPAAEYHEFKTNMILISDALSMKDSYSREPRKVVGFSSDAKQNRFYLFDSDVPLTPKEAAQIADKWNNIIRAIEEAFAQPGSGTR